MRMELVRVDPASADALRAVDAVLDDLAGYSRRVDGVARRRHAAIGFATDLPPGRAARHKHAFLAMLGGEAVGLADIVDGHPSCGTAFIGLLAVRETVHGSGIGRALFEAVERFARDEIGARTLRLAVVEANPVSGFWTKMGFHPTGEIRPYEGEAVTSRSILMEKALT